VNYRRIQIDKLKNVEFIPRTKLTAADAAEYGADLVVIATGSTWAPNGMNGWTRDTIRGADASKPHCLTPEQIMVEGKEPPGQTVLVYDCDGYFIGVSLAEKLASEGRRVTVVTPFPVACPYLEYTHETVHIHRQFDRLGVDVVSDHILEEIEPGRIVGRRFSIEGPPVVWHVDSVVLVTQRVSSNSLYRELKCDPETLEREGVRGVFRIGDCLEPRLIADCIFDGHRLAREIDSDDPASPRPVIRENLVLSTAEVRRLAIRAS
jgi:dimethylamine/trimethylamine dehydrogenase